MNFCVWSTWSEMKPLPDNLALPNDQGSYHRIWAGCALPLRRQAKGQRHEMQILLCSGHRLLRRADDGFRAVGAFFFTGFVLDAAAAMAACAAASRAIATRNGEQLT